MVEPTVYNLYYYDRARIDLAKLRAQANDVASGNWWGANSVPGIALIHYHSHHALCEGKTHERYSHQVDGVVSETFVVGAKRIYI